MRSENNKKMISFSAYDIQKPAVVCKNWVMGIEIYLGTTDSNYKLVTEGVLVSEKISKKDYNVTKNSILICFA